MFESFKSTGCHMWYNCICLFCLIHPLGGGGGGEGGRFEIIQACMLCSNLIPVTYFLETLRSLSAKVENIFV